MDEYKFYDFGWNAFVNGKPFVSHATLDWRDGWKDAEEIGATEEFPNIDEDEDE